MRRVLFTGLGSIGRRHLKLLREREESFDVHAFRSGMSEDEYEFDGPVHHTLANGLAADPDIAFITNPTSLHVETAKECAKAGCDLFIEKPLSHTMDGVDELIAIVDRNELISYVGCVFRFHPVLQRSAELMSSETLGEVYSFRAYAGSYLPNWRPKQDYRNSYSADPDLGGGVVLDLIHELDYSYWLFGDVDRCHGWTGKVSHLDIETEDLGEIVLEMESGVVGSVHLDYYRPTPKRTLEITGSEGVLEADLYEGSLDLFGQSDRHSETFDFELERLYADQLEYFLDHVETRTACENDLREAKNVLSIAIEAKEH